MEEREAELRLELPDGRAGPGPGDVQALRGGGHVAGLRDGGEVLDEPQLRPHRRSLSPGSRPVLDASAPMADALEQMSRPPEENDMTRLLHIGASPRGGASESLQIAATFLDAY